MNHIIFLLIVQEHPMCCTLKKLYLSELIWLGDFTNANLAGKMCTGKVEVFPSWQCIKWLYQIVN